MKSNKRKKRIIIPHGVVHSYDTMLEKGFRRLGGTVWCELSPSYWLSYPSHLLTWVLILCSLLVLLHPFCSSLFVSLPSPAPLPFVHKWILICCRKVLVAAVWVRVLSWSCGYTASTLFGETTESTASCFFPFYLAPPGPSPSDPLPPEESLLLLHCCLSASTLTG